jgi:hypothetical protein
MGVLMSTGVNVRIFSRGQPCIEEKEGIGRVLQYCAIVRFYLVYLTFQSLYLGIRLFKLLRIPFILGGLDELQLFLIAGFHHQLLFHRPAGRTRKPFTPNSFREVFDPPARTHPVARRAASFRRPFKNRLR